jgi:Uma2 family endonuclease
MMITHSSPFGEQRVLLHNLSWRTFETLIDELGETRSSRLTYHQGELEIMAPASNHEQANRMIEGLVVILLEELDLEFKRTGSFTCKRDDLERGAEPDSCYYIQHEAQVRNKVPIDLNRDPPPDLVVEVEYSQSALPKLQLYAAMGVPEFWRYDGDKLYMYQLIAGTYEQCQHSLAFSQINVAKISDFLEDGKQHGELKMTKSFRQWVKKQLG